MTADGYEILTARTPTSPGGPVPMPEVAVKMANGEARDDTHELGVASWLGGKMYDYELNDQRGIKGNHSIKKTQCHSEANNLFFCPKIGSTQSLS